MSMVDKVDSFFKDVSERLDDVYEGAYNLLDESMVNADVILDDVRKAALAAAEKIDARVGTAPGNKRDKNSPL